MWNTCKWDFPGGSGGKESACNAGDPGSIPGSGRSLEKGNRYPLKYSCLEFSCCYSVAKLCPTLCIPVTAAHQASLSFPISQSLLKFIPIESVMLSNHLILCCPLLLTKIFSSIRVFSSESALLIKWPKYWSFSPTNEHSGLISFRIDWFDLF